MDKDKIIQSPTHPYKDKPLFGQNSHNKESNPSQNKPNAQMPKHLPQEYRPEEQNYQDVRGANQQQKVEKQVYSNQQKIGAEIKQDQTKHDRKGNFGHKFKNGI